MSDKEDYDLKLSPAADQEPSVLSQARFRCGTEGPDEFDVFFESIIDEQFGYDPNSEYKLWVRRAYNNSQ
jgi:hypothetical protein